MKVNSLYFVIFYTLIALFIGFYPTELKADGIKSKKAIKEARKLYYEENNVTAAIHKLDAVYNHESENIECLKLMVEIYFDTRDSVNTRRYCLELLDIIEKEKEILAKDGTSKKPNKINQELDDLSYIINSRLEWANEKLKIRIESDKKHVEKPTDKATENKTTESVVAAEASNRDRIKVSEEHLDDSNQYTSSNSISIDINTADFTAFSSSDQNKQKKQLSEELAEYYKNDFIDIDISFSYANVIEEYKLWVSYSNEQDEKELIRLYRSNEDLLETISKTNRSIKQKRSTQKQINYLKDKLAKTQQDLKDADRNLQSFDSMLTLSDEDFSLRKRQFNTSIIRFELDVYNLNHILKYIQDDYLGKIQIHGILKGIKTIDKTKYTLAIVNYSAILDWDPMDFKYGNIESFAFNNGNLISVQDTTTLSFQELDLTKYEIDFINEFSQYNNSDEVSYPRINNASLLEFYQTEYNNLIDIKKNLESEIKSLNELLNLHNEAILEYRQLRDFYDESVQTINIYNPQFALFPEITTKQIDEQIEEKAFELFEIALNSLPNKLTGQFIPESKNKVSNDSMISIAINNINYDMVLSGFKIIKGGSLSLDAKDNLFLFIVFRSEGDLEIEVHSETEHIEQVIDELEEKDHEIADNDTNMPLTQNQESDNESLQDDEITSSSGAYKIISSGNIYNILKKDGIKWRMVEDNPSSYTVYKLFQKEEGWIIPDLSHLQNLFDYLIDKKKIGEDLLPQLNWPGQEAVFITSDIYYDNRNNRLHKALSLKGNSYEIVNVKDGDEVFIMVKSN